MKSLDERTADYLEKASLGLLLAAFVSDAPPWARVVFLIFALLTAAAMVAVTQRARGSNDDRR